MLPKKQKITRFEFPKDFRIGRRYNSPNISMLAVKFGVDSPNKYSCVVSSKVSKKAVLRNKIRRMCYSALKSYDKKGYFCIFFIKKGSSDLSYDNIRDEISELLKKI